LSHTCYFCQRIELHSTAPDRDAIYEFRHSIAYLGRWQFYHGYTVLILKTHATELSQLGHDVRHACFEVMCLMARAIETAFQPHKLNYEMLGNQVPHLHWHVFPRYADDENVHLPVWLATVAAEADPVIARRLEQGPTDRAAIIQSLRSSLARWVDLAD
jgi:diadenosine tetraphosphate (Ap4A) HIT family hydrolase